MIAVLGAFDGFHGGHALLIERARKLAESTSDDWAVVTFSPHPDSVVQGRRIPSLFTDEERDALARFLSIPNVLKIPFDEQLARTSPENFIRLLESLINLTGIVVGDDFRFGSDRKGDALFLKNAAGRKGWSFEKVDSLVLGGAKVGSSDIRRFVIAGDVDLAKRMLGYPFFFRGKVVPGDGRGRRLGFPTANIQYPEEKVVPRKGVYAASVLIGSEWWPGALNVGYNPTFLKEKREPRFETYILDLDKPLYGTEITVFPELYLRDEKEFDSIDKLLEQMRMDVRKVREVFDENQLLLKDIYCLLSKAFAGKDTLRLEKS